MTAKMGPQAQTADFSRLSTSQTDNGCLCSQTTELTQIYARWLLQDGFMQDMDLTTQEFKILHVNHK